MTTELQQKWAQCQTILADNLTSSAYQTWFAPIIPLQFENGVLVLQVKSQFVAEYIEENHIAVAKILFFYPCEMFLKISSQTDALPRI